MKRSAPIGLSVAPPKGAAFVCYVKFWGAPSHRIQGVAMPIIHSNPRSAHLAELLPWITSGWRNSLRTPLSAHLRIDAKPFGWGQLSRCCRLCPPGLQADDSTAHLC
jgi:hypothetical protein